MNRAEVNAQLRKRGFPELPPSRSEVAADAAELAEATRPETDLDTNPRRWEAGPSPRERAMAEIQRRFGTQPPDAA